MDLFYNILAKNLISKDDIISVKRVDQFLRNSSK